jgi:iron complex outermembrane recepter protein
LLVSGEILPGWNVIGGYTYNDAKVTKDNVIEEGNQLNNVPEHALSLATNYEIQQGDLKGLGLGLEIYFVGDRSGDLDNTFELPGYTRTDASIFYNRGKFRTALNFRNIFDINYFESAQSDLRVRSGDPFTVIGSVSFEF